MKKVGIVIGILATFMFLYLAFAGAVFAGTEEDAAKLLVKVLRAGRIVVSDAQPLLNDASKGDKGFTPEAFEEKWKTFYQKKYKADMNDAINGKHGDLVKALIKSGKQVVGKSQRLINKKGMGFKGFLPALWGRKTGILFGQDTGVRLKQTSVHFRYAGNKPDAFEDEILQMFSGSSYEKGKDYAKKARYKGKQVLRYMSPEYAAKSCLKCHGEPKGAKDITGMKKEGYKEGDLAGAISVVMPMK